MPKKLKFSKEVSPQFLSKNRTSYHPCFSKNQAKKKSFLEILDKKKNAFQTRKRKFSKSLTNTNLSKGLVHGFAKKISNPFKTRKSNFWKSEKNRIFPKGLVHGFCHKIDSFLYHVSLENPARKIVFYLPNEKGNALKTRKINF